MPANKPTFDHIDFASPHGIHFVLEMRRFPSGVIFQFRDRYIEIIRSYDSKLSLEYLYTESLNNLPHLKNFSLNEGGYYSIRCM